MSPLQQDDLRGMADLVGADRVIMGSDFPHAEGIAEPAAYADELKDFSAREVRMVMRENALELSKRRAA